MIEEEQREYAKEKHSKREMCRLEAQKIERECTDVCILLCGYVTVGEDTWAYFYSVRM